MMDHDPELAEMRGVKVPGAVEFMAAVALGAPMVFSYRTGSTTTVNGVVT